MLSTLTKFLGQGWCFVAAGLIYHLLAIWAVWSRRRIDRLQISRALAEPTQGAGISLLKPLCGCDEQLEKNLESFIQQSWQPLQILLGAVDAHDPALEVARRLQARYPERDIVVICEPAADF